MLPVTEQDNLIIEQCKDGFYIKNPDNTWAKIKVVYHLGGRNILTYKEERRGIYIHFRIIEREQRDGYCTETFPLLGDMQFKICVMPLERKSSKKMFEVIDKVFAYREAIYRLYYSKQTDELYNFLIKLF